MEQAARNEDLFARFAGNPAFSRSFESWSAHDRDLFRKLVESVHASGLDWWHVSRTHEIARFGLFNPANERATRVDGVVYSASPCMVSFRHGFAAQGPDKQRLTESVLSAVNSALPDRRQVAQGGRFGLWPDQLRTESAEAEDETGVDSVQNRTSVRDLLQEFLNSYTDARLHGSFAGHPLHATMRRLESAVRSLRSVANRNQLMVEGSVGKGNWAHVPWLAIMDPRETTSTQHGVYAVFLFREDMAGVYVTFNQGVTEPVRRLGRLRAHEELRSTAAKIRQKNHDLSTLGFNLDERINLGASGHLGRNYEVSTIAYKFYQTGSLPTNDQIANDLDAILTAYNNYVVGKSGSPSSPSRSWVFQANPDLYRIGAAARALPSLTFEVRQHASEIRTGDRVFLWQSGADAGAVARATVTSDPQIREFPQAELPFAVNSERFREPFLRVDLRVDSALPQTLARRELLSVPGLREASIIRGPQGTNFRLSPGEATTLAELYEASLNKRITVTPRLDLAAIVADFSSSLAESNLRFAQDVIRSFVSSLATKRFAILTGLSGSGKTQLALKFGQWCGPERLCVIPVRPDWTGPEYLIGYEDALLPTEGGRRAWHVPEALQFMLAAAADPQFPYVLVLDEMNLAHVERYFADILSGIESDEPCLPHLSSDEGYWRLVNEDTPKIRLPDNLFVIGTVNVDETTFMFSPKVLDRANTIEFRVHHSDLVLAPRRTKPLSAGPEDLVRGFLEIARDAEYHITHPAPGLDEYTNALRVLHEILAEAGFEFGYRTFLEAARFASLLAAAGAPDWRVALDLQVMQKMLPRIHGSRRRLETLLGRLEAYCRSVDSTGNEGGPPHLPKSLTRVERLGRSLAANQFAGFIE